jgi:hypothetical protein
MKIILCCLMLFLCCTSHIENQSIHDMGKKQIGEHLYLKKLFIGHEDRVYILVNENDEIVSGNVSTSYIVHTGKTSHVESNAFIDK